LIVFVETPFLAVRLQSEEEEEKKKKRKGVRFRGFISNNGPLPA